ncbi:FliH/SctL family protein [Cellulomonas sp. URHB0016]
MPESFVPHAHPAAAPTRARFRPSEMAAGALPTQFRPNAADEAPPTVVAFQPAPIGGTRAVDRAASEAARAEGFAAGFAAGAREAARVAEQHAREALAARLARESDAAAETTRALDVLASSAAAARSRTEPVVADLQDRLQRAALELAEALLGAELADHDRSARAALARALRHADGIEDVTVRLHPSDLAALRAGAADVPRDGVVLVADPTLVPGDAVAEHADGYLDARLTTAVARARKALGGAHDGVHAAGTDTSASTPEAAPQQGAAR